MSKRTYYTNGINEIRIYQNQPIPEGWVRGRVKSTVTTLGSKWYTDGNKNLLIAPNETVPTGFKQGRTLNKEWREKSRITLREQKRHHYTNGEVDISLKEGEKIPEGFYLGRPPMSQEQKDKISERHLNKPIPQWVIEKTAATKSLRGTFNTSKPEILFKKKLYEAYGKDGIRTNYKTTEYPFRCDFYIISLNQYIELNLHWTHGFRPYNPEDPECQKQLLEWQEKAKTSQFYKNAIETWTVRDVKKLQVARENNLNYKVIYKL